MSLVIGIDPGASGGIAYLHSAGTVSALKMPATEKDIWNELWPLAREAPVLAVLERIGPMPPSIRGGSIANFKIGESFGKLHMALVAAGIRVELVPPTVWQGKLNCRTKGDKNITKALAQRLFPEVKVTHAVADALLLAEYGRRFLLPHVTQATA